MQDHAITVESDERPLSAGQEELFVAVRASVAGRDLPPPRLSKEEMAARGELARARGPRRRTEMLDRA